MIDNRFENSLLKLYEIYADEFNYGYDNIKITGKRNLLIYINSFFRRWLFTSVINNIELSPANIIFEGTGHRYMLPSACPSSVNKMGNIEAKLLDFSADCPPIVDDIKIIYDYALDGISFSDELNYFDEEFYKKKKLRQSLNNSDPEYINYIIYISIRLGILNIMPSIGINMICQGDNSIFNKPAKDIFGEVVKEAINIASERISEYCGENLITGKDIIKWLTEENSVDNIFNKYFSIPDYEELLVENNAQYNDFLDSLLYERGIAFDKWFLTPFGYYMGLIIPSYTTGYYLYTEMEIFVEVINGNKKYGDDADYTLMLYAPCSYYRLSDVGCEFFNINKDIKSKHIFKEYLPEYIADLMYKGELAHRKDEIMYRYYPPFNVYSLKITWIHDSSVWFDVDVSEYFTLYEFSSYIVNCVIDYGCTISKFRFYTIPENMFTDYSYPPKDRRGEKILETTLNTIFNNRNTIMYSSEVCSGDYRLNFDCRIDLVNICENNASTRVPILNMTSKKFKNMFT